MADHYAILGVSRQASQEEIKRAYRKLARELHPDANADDPDAVERFKAVTHAYEVLSDPQKKQRYDMFGDERAASGMGGFGDISDIFSTFFGGVGGGAAGRGQGRGADVLVEVGLSLEDAARGVEKQVEIENLVECGDCHGSGAAPGTHPSRCSDCGGTGEIREVRRTMFGNMMTATACLRCGGRGQVITSPCKNCSGSGRVRVTSTLTVQIPAGVDDGDRRVIRGKGQAGPHGGPPGDLYIEMHVEPHDVFERAGDDLGCEIEVPMTVAALGGKAQVPTLEDEEEIEIEPGTQSGTVVRLRGRGMPRRRGRGRGELVVLLKVLTPTDLTREQAEVLERLAAMRGETPEPRRLFDRIKEVFG